MGYRELLKKYVRFLEMHAGDNFIEAIPYVADGELAGRDLAELRTVAGEIHRDSRSADDVAEGPNFNHRLRLLCTCYELSALQAAGFARVDIEKLRRWRKSPRSTSYLRMDQAEFARFERSLFAWLAAPERVENGGGRNLGNPRKADARSLW
jgi:hypothetical protein